LGGAVPLVLALVVFLIAPAAAHHKSDHETGGGNSTEAQATGDEKTEDNDSNDGGTPNNVVDEGDNAHPSGNDRSVEHGNSVNQGKAPSDPDDDTRGPERTNGGADKPDGPGGADLADQDGNNGCGNDDDFEDDNEGHCSGAPVPPTTDNPPTKPTPPGKIDDDDTTRPNPERTIPDEVLSLPPDGGLPQPEVAALPPAGRTSTLPMTGSSVAMVLLVGLGLIVLGSSMVVVRRKV